MFKVQRVVILVIILVKTIYSQETIVPPEEIHIYDDKRIEKTILLGPYNEGSDVNLVCEVKGGRPKPKVTWILGDILIDDSYQIRSDGIALNRLTFPNVGRQHLHVRLACEASNNDLVPPVTRVGVLDVNLKPQTVNILTKVKQVTAGKSYNVECRTSGSRPDAVITWWKESSPARGTTKNFSEQNNQSLSILTFIPVIEDDGKDLICRAEHPSIPNSALEDKWRLKVIAIPTVTLKMGSTINPDGIKEGDDVYFDCNIHHANPKAYNLSWFHNGVEIFQNFTAGIIVTNPSLVLQSVTRATEGAYTCTATKVEGKINSNAVQLVVQYNKSCTVESSGAEGLCKLLTDCQPVRNELLIHHRLPQTCRFQGTQPIVCCPKTKEGRKPGDISKLKCREYSSYAYDKIGSTETTKRECGHKIVKRIVGGVVATRKEFPHMAIIVYRKDRVCGGTIISEQYILTAAHCVINAGEALDLIQVQVGITSLNDNTHKQQIKASQIILYPEHSQLHHNNVALLKLEKPIELNSYARPACLYTNRQIPVDEAIATGWGRTTSRVEIGSRSRELLKVTLRLFDYDFCNKTAVEIIDDIHICTGSNTTGRDSCAGDSGGPLQIYHTGDDIMCMYDVVGILSFGSTFCNGKATGSTRISYYIKWIEDIVWPELPSYT